MKQGFTLFEVLVALSLFTFVAFSMVELLQTCLDTELAIRKNEVVTQGLRNQLAQVLTSRLQPVETDLPSPDTKDKVKYHLSVSKEVLFNQDKVQLNAMYRVTITARWPDSNQTATRNVSQLIYQP
jgi:prepilin-type N-terminal cleavage/methylation domain-containing protein